MAAAAILKFGLHSVFVIFKLSMFFLVCVQFSSKSDGNCPFYSIHLNFNMAAAIFKAVGHFRCCIFDYGWKSRNYSSNFIGIGGKLTELLQFGFFHNGGCRHLGWMIGDLRTEI
jgi:hypothetical protein